jgi:cytidylate kinase
MAFDAIQSVIRVLENNPVFQKLAATEAQDIVVRDQEDAEKLAQGVRLAIEKGALKNILPQPYKKIRVQGKSADEVADEIIKDLGPAKDKGCILILVGLSGTGKGTTISKLKSKLPNACSWSNGNCFRAVTLLAVQYCAKKGLAEFDEKVLTPANLRDWIGMLKFGKFRRRYDIKIKGLGIDAFVSDIANTKLRGPDVGRNIPTVARVTQGEVVAFAANACKVMGDGGNVVLLEGREQTLDHIPSPFRYCLTMDDIEVIGRRRAAQRIAGGVLAELNKEMQGRLESYLDKIVKGLKAEVKE